MATTTPLQNLPVPEDTDDPNVPADMSALATAIEKRLVGVYNSVADRDARITAPQEGQVAYLKDSNKIHVYVDGAWSQIFPALGLQTIRNGAGAPDNSVGVDGDVYFRV